MDAAQAPHAREEDAVSDNRHVRDFFKGLEGLISSLGCLAIIALIAWAIFGKAIMESFHYVPLPK